MRLGLSPHSRGNRGPTTCALVTLRPIPAFAGKPTAQTGALVRPRAYPRIRGETSACATEARAIVGLSPHSRGNPAPAEGASARGGPIPAFAGKPLRCPGWPAWIWAYPRIRGETRTDGRRPRRWPGLSPHSRGNLIGRAMSKPTRGPIPAFAGKPGVGAHRVCNGRAYPRIRGETRHPSQSRYTRWGLSPHSRGNPAGGLCGAVRHGPIPAFAGKPTVMPNNRCFLGAYPRIRGETPMRFSPPPPQRGLSPHSRGNLVCGQVVVKLWGPIPAFAGKPTDILGIIYNNGAYPRIRGETRRGVLRS
ncbi:MAG: hypothetical protein RLZZ352_2464 [Pseudomonadota bacterium]